MYVSANTATTPIYFVGADKNDALQYGEIYYSVDEALAGATERLKLRKKWLMECKVDPKYVDDEEKLINIYRVEATLIGAHVCELDMNDI